MAVMARRDGLAEPGRRGVCQERGETRGVGVNVNGRWRQRSALDGSHGRRGHGAQIEPVDALDLPRGMRGTA